MKSPEQWSDLRARMLSASAMILIGLLGIWLGGVAFHLLVALVCGLMVWELVGMLRGPGQAASWQLGLVTGAAVLASVYLPVGFGLPLLLAPALLGFGLLTANRTLYMSFTAMILLAGGETSAVAVGAWLILAARSVTAIVSVRDQVQRLHGKAGNRSLVIAADLAAVAIVAMAVLVSHQLTTGAFAVVAAIAVQRLLDLKPPPRAVILGIRQTILGLLVVVATAVGILAS